MATYYKWFATVFLATAVAHECMAQARNPHPTNPLSSVTKSRLRTLEALDHLNGVKWYWHTGNLAHGEDFTVGNAGWQPMVSELKPGPGAVWLRADIRVPDANLGYGVRGALLTFSVRLQPHAATTQILYLNGQRVAMGTDLEPERLSQCLVPGQTLHFAVKLLSTDEGKQIQLPDLTLTPVGRPDPNELAQQIEAAAILLPSLDDASVLSHDVATLEHAVSGIDMEALASRDDAAFDRSLENTITEVASLRPKLAQLTLDAVGNSHIDAAWQWPWTDTVTAVRNTFGTALQLMQEYPRYDYAQPDAQYDAWMEDKYPVLFAEMQHATADKRWEPEGGMWAEPDLNMPDGETMVRELLIGKRYMQSRFGTDVRIGWNPDSFGYSWQLPQVYKKSGVSFFVTQKMSWNETNHLPLKLFWWEAPDGSAVLTYFPQGYSGNTDPVKMANELANGRAVAPGLTEAMHLFGVSDHGGGPTRVELDEADRLQDHPLLYPKLSMTLPSVFFAHVAPLVTPLSSSPVWNYETLAAKQTKLSPQPGRISIPVWKDELYLEYHRGTYTTQAQQKKNMRDSEEWMLDAEKFASIAWLEGGIPYQTTRFNDAWKKVLFNTNHDLAAGSGIGLIYKDAQVDYNAVHAFTSATQREDLGWMEANADTRQIGDAIPVVVVNSLAWARSGTVSVDVQLPHPSPNGQVQVTDAHGQTLPVQVLQSDAANGQMKLLIRVSHVPSLGYTVLSVRPGTMAAVSDLHVNGTTLENDALKVVIDPNNGCITHLIRKADNFDAIANGGCGNQLQRFHDEPARFDAWNIDASALKTMKPIQSADEVRVTDRGPVRASILVRRHWDYSTFDEVISLDAESDEVDIHDTIGWHETHVLLKVAMPLRASSAKAAFEIPFGVIERPTSRANSVDAAKFEVPALRWADLGDANHGLALLNNSKYGYDATAHLLRLSLLRSPTSPDPNADRGEQQMDYAFYPHPGTWQKALVERRGYEFNYRLTAVQSEPHLGAMGREHSFLTMDNPAVILTALKKAEDGNALVLRAFNWTDQKINVNMMLPGVPVRVSEASMLEVSSGSPLPLHGSSLATTFSPYEIKTLRIEYAGPEANAGKTNGGSSYASR